jgi:preprotein translocase subunit SecG
MNWNQILEKSWHYLVKRRYLIWLGGLAALTEGGSIYSGSNYSTSGKELENSANFQEVMSVVTSWVSSHLTEITIVLVALFLIGLIILYISYSARAGLIHGVNVLEIGKDSNFHQDFEAGKSFFWRFLGLRILIAITLILILVLLILSFIGVFVLAVSYSAWLMLPIALLCIPAVFGFVLLAVYLSLASALAERFIVIKNLPIIESIDRAIHLVREKIAVVVVAWLINLVINIVTGITYLVLIVIPVVISIVLGSIAYLIGKEVGLLIVIPLGIILIFAVSLLARGIFTTYLSAYWTIIYKRLVESS